MRSGKRGKDMAPGMVAALTLSVLGVIFRVWFEQGQKNIDDTVEQVFGTIGGLMCQTQKVS